MTDPLEQALNLLTPVLEALGIQYLIIGSLASSAHGVYRATADGDLLVKLSPGQAAQLSAALGPGWYADEAMIERAVRDRRCFNLIHMILIHITTAQKIDIFPATNGLRPAVERYHGDTGNQSFTRFRLRARLVGTVVRGKSVATGYR